MQKIMSRLNVTENQINDAWMKYSNTNTNAPDMEAALLALIYVGLTNVAVYAEMTAVR